MRGLPVRTVRRSLHAAVVTGILAFGVLAGCTTPSAPPSPQNVGPVIHVVNVAGGAIPFAAISMGLGNETTLVSNADGAGAFPRSLLATAGAAGHVRIAAHGLGEADFEDAGAVPDEVTLDGTVANRLQHAASASLPAAR